MEYVVLVDREDNEVGLEEKCAAHSYPAKLHRAFSVFILNDRGQLLLQKRNRKKKTWPGFWSNSCCSHPRPNEPIGAAAQRRLHEELGFSCELEFLFKFHYTARFDQDWGENEVDHIFLGYHNGAISPNAKEVAEVAFMDLDELRASMDAERDKYTPWLKICFQRFLDYTVKVRTG